jgi:hypothetical protein
MLRPAVASRRLFLSAALALTSLSSPPANAVS